MERVFIGVSRAEATRKADDWRAEFDRLGEDQVITALLENRILPEPKRQVGFRWLSERADDRRNNEGRTFNYVR